MFPSTAYQGAKTLCLYMIWMWDAVCEALEPQPWPYRITWTSACLNFPKIHPHLHRGNIVLRQLPIPLRGDAKGGRLAMVNVSGLSIWGHHCSGVFWMDGAQRFEITYVKPKLQPPKSILDEKYVLGYSNLSPNSKIGTWKYPQIRIYGTQIIKVGNNIA